MYAGAYLEMSKSGYVQDGLIKFLGCEIDTKRQHVVTHDGKKVSFNEPKE
jgi:hypothetical protein